MRPCVPTRSSVSLTFIAYFSHRLTGITTVLASSVLNIISRNQLNLHVCSSQVIFTVLFCGSPLFSSRFTVAMEVIAVPRDNSELLTTSKSCYVREKPGEMFGFRQTIV